MNKVYSFSVLPFTELSDHCCISVTIKVNREHKINDENKCCTKINPNKMPYIFDKNRITICKENIRTDENLQLLQTILNKVEPSREEVLGSISHLNNVLLNAAKKSFLRRKTLHKTKAKNYKKQNKKWFNKDCAEYRKVLRKYSRKLSTHSFDRNTLHLFQKYRMKYKSLPKS